MNELEKLAAMAPLAKDDPRMVAWEEYKATADYKNTRNWALHEAHVDGSLWAAFVAGMEAAWEPRQFEKPEDGLAEKFIEALERSAGVQGVMIDADDCGEIAAALRAHQQEKGR